MDLSNPLIKIHQWTGRLGNNINQLINAIKIALYYEASTIVFPHHQYFNTTTIELGPNKVYSCTFEDMFYYPERIAHVDKSLFSKNNYESGAILRKYFIIDPLTVVPLGKKDLVIHIRSGDIFKGPFIHPVYTPLPVSHYVKIIEQNSFDKIYLVAEDNLNPVINELIKLFPKIIFKIQSLDKDIRLILGASYIASSFGTFIPCLTVLSTHTPHIFSATPSHLEPYRREIGPWKNEIKQNTALLTYKIPDNDSYYKILP